MLIILVGFTKNTQEQVETSEEASPAESPFESEKVIISDANLNHGYPNPW